MEPLDESIGTPPDVTRALEAVRRTRVTEAALVFVVALSALALTGATAYNTYRVRQLLNQNQKSQDFGLKAVECILDNFAEHRWSNQAFHDSLAQYLKAPFTPHTPLPNLPTNEQFMADCDPFNRARTTQPPLGRDQTPITIPKGGP